MPDPISPPGKPPRPLTIVCALLLVVVLTLLLAHGAVLPASADPVLALALAVGVALCGLGQTLALRRARARVRALESRLDDAADERTRGRLAGLLRAASRSSIIATDLEGVIQVFNAGAERMLGYRAEELVGKETPELFHLPAEVQAYAGELSGRLGRTIGGFEAFTAAVRQGGPGAFDSHRWTYVRKDGGQTPVELTITGVYSDAGELEGFLGVGLDLSEHKALEADLQLAQISVDNAGDMILWGTLEEGRLVYANQAACDILGYSRQELLGMNILELNPTRTVENWHAHGESVRAHGRITQETSLRRKDGVVIPVESTSTLVERGGVQYSLGIIRDITKRKAAEERLRSEMMLNRSLAEAAEAASRAKSELLANMTHEVRTPLNGILGMLQVLQSTDLSAEQQEYAGVALLSAERLHLLLDNAIDYARLDSGLVREVECLVFPPTDLLHSLAAVFEPQAKAKELTFALTAGPELPELVRADPQALRQALAQLLDNAIKFTAAGTVRLSADLDAQDASLLVFRVEDTGIGIPADKREKIFGAFVQADAGITRTYGGAGLGLAIARRLAERMGGSVSVEDQPGGGTVMTLTIPADCTPKPTA